MARKYSKQPHRLARENKVENATILVGRKQERVLTSMKAKERNFGNPRTRNTPSKPSCLQTLPDICVNKLRLLQFVAPAPVPPLVLPCRARHLRLDEIRRRLILGKRVRLPLEAENGRDDIVPLLSFHKVNEGAMPSRRRGVRDTDMIPVFGVYMEHVFHVHADEGHTGAVDSVQHRTVI